MDDAFKTEVSATATLFQDRRFQAMSKADRETFTAFALVVGWTSIAGIVGSIYGIGYIKNRRCRKAAAAAAEKASAAVVPPTVPST